MLALPLSSALHCSCNAAPVKPGEQVSVRPQHNSTHHPKEVWVLVVGNCSWCVGGCKALEAKMNMHRKLYDVTPRQFVILLA